MAGHPREALGFGRSARDIAESLGDVPLQVTGNLYFASAYICTGDYRRAEASLRKVLRLLEGDLGRERLGQTGFPAVSVHYYLVWTLADLGRFEEGILHGREGLRLAEGLNLPYGLANVNWILAYLQITRGELGPAITLLERVRGLTRDWNLAFLSVFDTGCLGYAYALSGRIAEGIPLLEQALTATETMALGAVHPLFLLYLGEAYVLAGRLDDALDFAGRGLALAREGGQRGFEAWALRLFGEATARRDPPTRAAGHYRDALALAEELEMRPLIAHCHLGLGKVPRPAGDGRPPLEHLTVATAMYREMAMAYWVERAEAEIRRSARASVRSD
jgi:tetratricopeptide (TPR) repeat protein